MEARAPHARRNHRPSVLVVAVNFAVAHALGRRLRPHAAVAVRTLDEARASRLLERGCDAVLLCPYLRSSEREAARRLVERRFPAAVVLSIEDRGDGHVLRAPSALAAPAGRLIDVIARALDLPVVDVEADTRLQRG